MAKLKTLFNDCKIINGKICNIEYIRYLKFKKDYTDHVLEKRTIAHGIKIGVSNETASNNQLSREDQKPDYIASPLKGKEWIQYPILCKSIKTGEKFLKLENWKDQISWKRFYSFDNKDIENIEKYHPMLLASEYKKYPNKNITEREKIYLTIGLDKIVCITVNNTTYYQ